MVCAKSQVLDEKGIKILKALAEFTEPATCKQISEKSGVPVKSVIGKMRALVRAGYVERPEKGKYIITDKGKEAIKK
ncbi:MAG: hypothetical protein DRJ52_09215 [Thermoprotei archaeon]|nr:MAG: hypothetical protein DRJ52_09215 [Thermoprotei archaeon]